MKKIFKNKKVVIMGLGLVGGGVSIAKFFCRQGADVLVTDLKSKKELKDSLKKLNSLPIKYVLGKHRKKDFLNADLIIKNPAVPWNSLYLKIAKDRKIPITTDIEIFFNLCKGKIIGVTGTKGKSTTATLIYKILKKKYPAVLAGNIGVSPLEFLFKIKKQTKVVLELSSFELENLKKSPHVAVITNLFPDHLDRYKSFSEYIQTKKNIFKHQKKNDILVLNYDNIYTRKLSLKATSRVLFFSKRYSENVFCFIKENKIFTKREKNPIIKLDEIKLEGEHNLSNILAAVSTCKILNISSRDIREVLRNFKGISCRQEFVVEKRGVKYFNDTTSTTPDSTVFAIRTLKKKFPKSNLILIAGGQDKNLNYEKLAKEIKEKVSFLLLLPGSASEKIKKRISKTKLYFVKSMKEAVRKATSLAQEKDIVLFSPAAASFNLFKNEFDRGNQFINAVKKI